MSAPQPPSPAGNGRHASVLQNLGVLAALVTTTMVLSLLWQACSGLSGEAPSRYDPGLTVEAAARQSAKPLLIEFYSDDCGACRSVTPMIHHTYQTTLANRLTLVMVNVARPDAAPVAETFGVQGIPAVFVFDPKRMQKTAIPYESLSSPEAFTAAIEAALQPE